MITEPRRSPWGRIQSKNEVLPGIFHIETAGHGGYWVTAARARAMPKALRVNNRGNYFEEDCEWGLVVLAFLEEFQEISPGIEEDARRTVKNWFPDAYESFTGEEIPTAESYVKRKRQFDRDNKHNWVVVSAVGDWHADCPIGMVLTVATLGGVRNSSDERVFIVPKHEYDQREGHGFVIDLSRHQEVQTQ